MRFNKFEKNNEINESQNKNIDVIQEKPKFKLFDREDVETEEVTADLSPVVKKGGEVLEHVGKKAQEKSLTTANPKVAAVVAAGGKAAELGGKAMQRYAETHDIKLDVKIPKKYAIATTVAERLNIAKRKNADAKNADVKNADAKAETIKKNKIDGSRREYEVGKELSTKYPSSKGYSIIREAYLRDKDGNIVKDSETGQARRIDYVVVKDGKTIKSIEVTSETADKANQMEKEKNIKASGGIYIKDTNGNLIKHSVNTDIERRA